MSTKKSPRYWLIKSEPSVYSIDHLKSEKRTWWEGIRNYQARNFMMNDMKPGDLALLYHSNAEPAGIAGVCKISSQAAEADATQFDKKSEYFDPKATKEKPRWLCAEVEFVEKFSHYISLPELRNEKSLAEMLVLKAGQRLSIQPVTEKHFQILLKMGRGQR